MIASAAVTSFPFLDCQPSLFWYDRLVDSESYWHGKRIWIIGASSGIGEELACQLADSNCRSLVLSSRSKGKLDVVANECRSRCPDLECHVVEMDVCDYDSMKDAVEKVPGGLDVVFLNTGRGQLRPAEDTSAEAVNEILHVNAAWPMQLVPLLLPKVKHFVVTSSIAGKIPVPLSSVYTASKFALMGYFGSLQTERPDVRVDLLCPGPVDTAFHHNHSFGAARTPSKVKASNLKMPVERCAKLMLSAVSRPGGSREVWIAPQPSLGILYLQRWAPGLVSWMLSIIGPRRVDMWRRGLDLYDVDSWKNSKPRD